MTQPRFLAFILANDQEEFLVDYKNECGVIARVWGLLPDRAKRYPTRRAADYAISKLEAGHPVYVLELLDEGDRFIVAADEAFPRPSWLAAFH